VEKVLAQLNERFGISYEVIDTKGWTQTKRVALYREAKEWTQVNWGGSFYEGRVRDVFMAHSSGWCGIQAVTAEYFAREVPALFMRNSADGSIECVFPHETGHVAVRAYQFLVSLVSYLEADHQEGN
jgi:hypothetical protein